MVRLSDAVCSTRSADGAVALDRKNGRMFRLNPTGSRILELLRSGAEANEIARVMIDEFSADPATAEADTQAFLELLRQHALLEPHLRK